ncbi:MAG: hypothetical protein IJ331_02210 [Ruminococcus sp.]|nr:hypothetical protein [Ruminococcus sp.]
MKVFKKVLNTIINILIIAVLVVSILVATLALTSKSSGISNIFGYTFQVIVSDSMAGGNPEYDGGDFARGDVIIGNIVKNQENPNPEEFEVGDIVTYKGELQNNEHLGEQLICHRIVAVDKIGETTVYQTQGDNRQLCPVPDQEEITDFIFPEQIVAKFYTEDFQGKKLAGVGKIYEFINSQLGFFLCILLPMIVFFLYVLITVVINFVEYKKAKEDEEKEKNAPKTPQMTDEEYEQFKQFMAQKNAQASVEDAPSSEEV